MTLNIQIILKMETMMIIVKTMK